MAGWCGAACGRCAALGGAWLRSLFALALQLPAGEIDVVLAVVFVVGRRAGTMRIRQTANL